MRTSGEIVAATLAGSWRHQTGAPALTPTDLATVMPLLLESGAGALAWYRLRDSPLASPAGELRQAYRLHAIQAALHETKIKQVVMLLRDAGVEPILVKGWAIARLYPESGLRPYGDFDLCVRPEDYTTARAALRSAGDRYPVDLHKGTGLLDDRVWDEIFERSQLVMLKDVPIRVLAPEDHLRVLCFHWLRHGGERPIGLCDIALLLESRSNEFDWTTCLGKSRKHASWISCVLGLARRLLKANVGEIPFAVKEKQPAWIVEAVLKAWGTSFSKHFSRAAPLEFYWRHPRGLAQALMARWPTPIVGTVGVDGSINGLPRFPYQLGYLLLRSGRFVKQLTEDNAQAGR